MIEYLASLTPKQMIALILLVIIVGVMLWGFFSDGDDPTFGGP